MGIKIRRYLKCHVMLQISLSCTLVCAVLVATAELHTLLSVVGLYYKTFKGATLIVKNKYFKNLLGNTQVWSPYYGQSDYRAVVGGSAAVHCETHLAHAA